MQGVYRDTAKSQKFVADRKVVTLFEVRDLYELMLCEYLSKTNDALHGLRVYLQVYLRYQPYSILQTSTNIIVSISS